MSNATRGILTMLAAILCFTINDLIAKLISHEVGTIMAVWARYLGQVVLVSALVLPRGRAVFVTKYPKLQAARSVFLLGATTFFFFAITHIGLAEATAIMDVNPVLITLGAALVLGERFGPRRAIGVAVSLLGALIIIRPGSAVFQLASILPLCAALCYAGYALMTRFVGRDESIWTSLFYTGLFGAFALCLIVPFHWQSPDRDTALLMLAIGGTGTLSQLLLIRSLQLAEASLVAPFGYVGLIFATLWGILFFDEYPDAMTILGMGIIALAGLYVWHRETFAKPQGIRDAPAKP